MEAKKNPSVNMERKRGLFLEIGLIVAFGLVIAVFSASHTAKDVDLDFADGIPIENYDMPDIVIEKNPPVPEDMKRVMAVITDYIRVMDSSTKIDENAFEFPEFSSLMNLGPIGRDGVDEQLDEAAPVVWAEVMPTFQGGDLNAFRAWVNHRLSYPDQAARSGIQGKVTLQFVIEKDGSLSNIEVIKTPDRSLSDEAIRILRSSPKWEPGMQNKMPVRVKFTLPIDFVLN